MKKATSVVAANEMTRSTDPLTAMRAVSFIFRLWTSRIPFPQKQGGFSVLQPHVSHGYRFNCPPASGLESIVKFDGECPHLLYPIAGLEEFLFGTFNVHLQEVDRIESGFLHQCVHADGPNAASLNYLKGNLAGAAQAEFAILFPERGMDRQDVRIAGHVPHEDFEVGRFRFKSDDPRLRIPVSEED